MDDKKLAIKRAKLSELPSLLEVQFRAYQVHTSWLSAAQIPPLSESIEDLAYDFQNKVILVACIDRKVVGSVRYKIKTGVCMLERLSTDPFYQKKGIASTLVRTVEQQALPSAHKVYLETALLAHDLILFYSNWGYSGEAILRNHYGNFDWLALSKSLDKD